MGAPVKVWEWAEIAWEAFRGFGLALTMAVKSFFGFFNIPLADWMIQFGTTIALLLIILKYGKYIGKLLVILLLIVITSVLVGALVPQDFMLW